MPHYRTMYDERFVGSWDIDEAGKDVTITIAGVTSEEIGQDQNKDRKIVIAVKGSKKGFVVNKTNAGTIAHLHGTDTDAWVGKKVTLYATDVRAFGKQHRCIRVRDKVAS